MDHADLVWSSMKWDIVFISNISRHRKYCGIIYSTDQYKMKTFVCLCLVVLLAGLTNAGHSDLADCNGTPYNRHDEVCCDDVLSDRPGGNHPWWWYFFYPLRCCGTVPYTMGLCCNEIVDPTAERGERCCQDITTYNINDEICCEDGTTIDRPDDARSWDRLGCCGDPMVSYNKRTQFCCNDQVEDYDGDSGCCNDELYDLDDQICCSREDGPVADKPSGFAETDHFHCCNDVAYNVRTQICCAGTIQDRFDGTPSRETQRTCCGAVPYVFSTHVCCNDTITVRVADQAEYCCHETLYDWYTQRCCRADADNAAIYDPETEVCCDGAVVEVSDEDEVPSVTSWYWFYFEHRYCEMVPN